jgi:CheY-like chemotaxis protein
LSRDSGVVRVLRPSLEKLAIEVQVFHEAEKARKILVAEKFDAVIVDCDDVRGGVEILRSLRSTPSNKNSVTFAILNGKTTTTQDVFDMGVNFVLQKPISVLNASRCLNAALNFMVSERRRYFRQPVRMLVRVAVGDRELRATGTNISEGGLAVFLPEALPKGATPRLKFTLAGTQLAMDVEGELAWADGKGHAGFRFRNVPQSSQQHLEHWLDQQMEKDLPGSTGRIAATSEPTPTPPGSGIIKS